MVKLDDMDFHILRALEKDARASYRKMATSLGISVGTIHNRINKLKRSGVLRRFLVDIDERQIGYKLRFLILISIDGKQTENVLKSLSSKPQIISLFHITGEQSAAMICRFKEMDDVQAFILELNKNQYITKTSSSMILHAYKDEPFSVMASFSQEFNDDED